MAAQATAVDDAAAAAAAATAEAEAEAEAETETEEEDDDEDDEGNFEDDAYWDDFYADDEIYDWYSAAGAVYACAARELVALGTTPIECLTVVDVGCGTAQHLGALAALGLAHVVGVDFSQKVCEVGRAASRGCVSYVRADARRLPFASGSVDVALDKGCFDCFVSSKAGTHAQVLAYLGEVSRVLKPGGVLVLCAVSGVDVPHLLATGRAVRHRDDRLAARGAQPNDDWERRRSSSDVEEAPMPLAVVQIVAADSKHIFRCVKREEAPRGERGGRRLLDEDAVARLDAFDDQIRDVGLEDGLFCGRCAHRVLATLDAAADDDAPTLLPEACPACRAPIRRFAMS